jgi:hypothetical protein
MRPPPKSKVPAGASPPGKEKTSDILAQHGHDRNGVERRAVQVEDVHLELLALRQTDVHFQLRLVVVRALPA